jgi:hypothetical protein
MTRLLALDWEQDRCYLLEGNWTKGNLHVHQTAVWSEPLPTTPDQAEILGKKFRDFLKSTGFSTVPVLACLGRERILLKEISFPPVNPQEEPALVRFQATKDLLDSPEDVLLDYAPLAQSSTENRALVAILRRDLLAAQQTLCKAAGLKLLALVPRPFVIPGILTASQQAGEIPASIILSSTVAAVLVLGPTRAELTMVRGATVLFARSINLENALEAEVRRSLAIFASQSPASVLQALYLVGTKAPDFRDRLQANVNLPVISLRGLPEGEPTPAEANFAAALSLLQIWSEEKVPINFVRSREAQLAAPTSQRSWVLVAGLAFLAFLGLVFFTMHLSNQQKARLQQLAEEKASVENRLKNLGQDRLDLETLKDFDQARISWIDEFYDLTARFPDQVGFYLTKVQGEPIARRTSKDKFVARVNLTGLTPPGKDYLVHQFLESLRDDHLQARIERFKGGSSQEFVLKVDIAPQDPGDYLTRLVLPPPPKAPPPRADATASLEGPGGAP